METQTSMRRRGTGLGILSAKGAPAWFHPARAVAVALRRARQIREIARRPEPRPTDPPDPITPPQQQPASTGPAVVAIRLGFSVDIVGYSRRSTPAKEDLQQRLAALLDAVLGDIGTNITDTDCQGTGDGMHVFLPQTIQLHHVLPALLRSWRDRLAQDNRRFTDRMRLRLAAAIGPVGMAALGFGGSTVIEVSRLLDSPPVRQLVIDEPQRDLAAILSDQLYSYVVGEGYPGLAADEFRPTEARVKTFSPKAWLWRP